MRITPKRVCLLLVALLNVLLAANAAWAQDDKTPKKQLRSPATAKGFIGGESHDSYVIRVRKGQRLKVEISWRQKDQNLAEFTVSESSNFFNAEPVKFGKASDNDKRWIGKAPKTGNYYIYVVGHSTAHYTLSVMIE